MRKLYNEYFHIPEEGKIGDKVMLVRVVFIVACMIFCLGSMTLTAYAYFTYNVTSSFNSIQTGVFETNITVTENGVSKELTKVDDKTYQITLDAEKEYQVTLAPAGTTDTGFCIIKTDSSEKVYHTQQLGADETAENKFTPSITFTFKAIGTSTITFSSHWGTSTYFDAYSSKGENEELYVTNGEVISIGIKKAEEEPTQSEKSTQSEDVTETVGVTEPAETTEPTGTSESTETTKTIEVTESTENLESVESTEGTTPSQEQSEETGTEE